MPSPAAIDSPFDSLTTPVAWCDGSGAIVASNAAMSGWLGVGVRRLQGWPMAALDAGDG
ncbi:PAS domain-containing sensor histidine kinase, partial [Lysobacter maris]